MYADDTADFTSSSNVNAINVNIQSDLESVHTWLNVNKLSLHIGETTCMFVCSRQKRQDIQNPSIKLNLMHRLEIKFYLILSYLNLNGHDITQVASIDYLGSN